jgi:hypothetical protein
MKKETNKGEKTGREKSIVGKEREKQISNESKERRRQRETKKERVQTILSEIIYV